MQQRRKGDEFWHVRRRVLEDVILICLETYCTLTSLITYPEQKIPVVKDRCGSALGAGLGTKAPGDQVPAHRSGAASPKAPGSPCGSAQEPVVRRSEGSMA
ncbi:hypothetical protein Kisp02_13320 [Kineosporia sp. NBRC 101731]|nr:hypothetical protein Kisp02_13320 [Kineosporia sp. NBRC 101731]